MNKRVPVPIPLYRELYEVSREGKVWSVRSKKYLSPNINCRSGYHSVELYNNYKARRINIHRLVALAFIPNPDGLLEINHIDGDRNNNTVFNLEWTTRSDNCRHAFRIGLSAISKKCREAASRSGLKRRKLSDVQVSTIREMLANGDTQYAIARKFSVCQKTISNLALGRHYQSVGLGAANESE
jgi:hypothetical protein